MRNTMIGPEMEKCWREAFVVMLRMIIGLMESGEDEGGRHAEQTPDEEETWWGRFKAERKPGIPAAPSEDVIVEWQPLTISWIVAATSEEALSEPGSGYTCRHEPGPDGKVKRYWYKAGAEGRHRAGPTDN
jgi:hypothetical protein